MPFRPTLAHARASSLPSSVGLCSSDLSAVAAIVNEAQERLLNDPLTPDEGWWGGWAKMTFNVTVTNRTAYVTTPREVARLILLDVCQRPVRIRNGFYEFLEFGRGLQPKECTTCGCHTQREGYERENVFTLSDLLSTPQKIRIYPGNSSDVGKRVLLQGTDQNGLTILGVDSLTQQAILGEYVSLNLPFSDSVNQFQTLTGILKDVTLSPATFFQVDPNTGNQVALSSMEPQETTASYRRYLLNGLPDNCCNTACGTVQIVAQARLDFIPVVSDPDYLFIQSIPALIEEVQAIRYSRMDSAAAPQFEAKHHARAIQLLNGQLDLYEGKTNTAVKVSLFGSDRLRLQPG